MTQNTMTFGTLEQIFKERGRKLVITILGTMSASMDKAMSETGVHNPWSVDRSQSLACWEPVHGSVG